MHNLHLTKSQCKSICQGKSVNISLDQIHNPTDKHNHLLEFDYEKTLNGNKGFRLSPKHIIGGKISIVDELKGPISKAVMQKGANAIINAIPVLNNNQKDSAKILTSNLINNNNQQQSINAINGLGLKLVKGSPEAKEHMARLRSMKGKGIMDSVKNFVKGQINDTKKAGKAIFLNPNIAPAMMASIATGEPAPLLATIGANTANYAINSATGQKGNFVSSKNVSDAYKSQQPKGGNIIEIGKGILKKRGRPRKIVEGRNIMAIGSGLFY